MKVMIILLLTIKKALFELNSTNNINKRLIADGTEYDASKYPFVVCIKIFTDKTMEINSICTGSLIHKLYVLTAAHCVYGEDKSLLQVYLGSAENNNDFREVVELHVHKDFDPESNIIQGDVSLFKLNSAFPNSTPIKIGGNPNDFSNNKALECINIGFGVMDTKNTVGKKGYMIKTNVRNGETACKEYDIDLQKDAWKQYLCSQPTTPNFKKMTCPGDSGGPMVCNNLLYGVCSYYYNFKGEKNECGVPDMQTVHVFIHYHKKWINDKMKGDIDENEKKKKEKKEKKKKKRKKKSSGNSIKPNHIFQKVLTILLYCMLNKI
ncbi:hypothetical protein AGLY_009458 [Aphis glycines]|uniref:Peptidase S1 domain-containing protein n=1 Tax=Aphis glycines TaxID=307491 RepID=A0A6G0TJR2_APHGL|nr:hypothetical protein AGLY_009458 [Aphis glycines]